MTGLKNGTVTEAFGAGTAASISHIDAIGHEGTDYKLPPVEQRKYSNKFFEELNAIKYGLKPDPFGWIVKL